jgi:hypothetical protein
MPSRAARRFGRNCSGASGSRSATCSRTRKVQRQQARCHAEPRTRQGSRERQAGAGENRPVRALRADRHGRGRRQAAFRGHPRSKSMQTITLEEALELFKLPRELGETPDGLPVMVNIGRFGPFVKYGARYASLKKDDDPYTIDLERALEIVREKEASMPAAPSATFPSRASAFSRGVSAPMRPTPGGARAFRRARMPPSRSRKLCKLLDEAPAKKGAAKKGGRARSRRPGKRRRGKEKGRREAKNWRRSPR